MLSRIRDRTAIVSSCGCYLKFQFSNIAILLAKGIEWKGAKSCFSAFLQFWKRQSNVLTIKMIRRLYCAQQMLDENMPICPVPLGKCIWLVSFCYWNRDQSFIEVPWGMKRRPFSKMLFNYRMEFLTLVQRTLHISSLLRLLSYVK